MVKLLTLTLTALTLTAPASAEPLQSYADYRAEMIAKGWEPLIPFRATTRFFDEVVCGQDLCFADWRAPRTSTVPMMAVALRLEGDSLYVLPDQGVTPTLPKEAKVVPAVRPHTPD